MDLCVNYHKLTEVLHRGGADSLKLGSQKTSAIEKSNIVRRKVRPNSKECFQQRLPVKFMRVAFNANMSEILLIDETNFYLAER